VSILEVFFNRTGCCSVSILMTEYCLIVFLNGLDIGDSGYHTLQICLTHAVTSYGAFWKIVIKNNLHTIEELKQEVLVAVISISKDILPAVVWNLKCLLQMVMDTDASNIEKVYLCNCYCN
jgi:hypothetical protein